MVSANRRTLLKSIGAGAVLGIGASATAAGDEDAPFRDPDRPLEERVEDLLGRLSTDEKIGLLHQYQQPTTDPDLDSFRTGTEALHGVAWYGDATVFPQPIGLGSTWDPDLIEAVGSAVGDEVRGMADDTNGGVGLNVWCPVTDPLRDPRWGRNEEGYAEDPTLSGEAAAAYARGLAGQDSEYLKTAPTLKHFIGYNNETERTTTNAELPPRLLHEYYLPFFRPPIEAGDATGVMASYNLVNGRPMTVSPLLSDPIRDWAPEGEPLMNVSDAWAPVNLTGAQEYFDANSTARAAALRAGLDSFTEWGTDNSTTVEALTTAVENGELEESTIDDAAGHVLSVRMRLGEFDPDEQVPYTDIGEDVVNSPDHRELAHEAAQESAVLLDNANETLPLSDDESVAVVGPLADAVFTDWYSGTLPYSVTVRDGVRDRIGHEATRTSPGADVVRLRHVDSGQYVTCGVSAGGGALGLQDTSSPSVQQFEVVQWAEDSWTLKATANNRFVTVDGEQLTNSAETPDGWETVGEAFEFVDVDDGVVLRHRASDSFVAADGGSLSVSADSADAAATFEREVARSGTEAAAEVAGDADAAVVVIGSHPLIGARETSDRETLQLPPEQVELVERVAQANERTAVVLQTSYPVDTSTIRNRARAVLWLAHAGQETGSAVAELLFGDRSPGGRLTQTWPRSVDQLPDITEYNIAETGMTYRYGQENPLYAFGHGHSYTDFEYGRIDVDGNQLEEGDAATVTVEVENAGSITGDEVVQLYSRQHRSRTDQPERVLRDFERVSLEPGERATVEFTLAYDDFAIWDVTRNRWAVEDSNHELLVGSAVDDVRGRKTLQVDGERIRDRDLTEPTRAVDADDWSWDDVELLDRSRADGTVVELADGAWLTYTDVDLRSNPSAMVATVARPESGATTLEVRRGTPDGAVLGTVEVPQTDGVYEYTDVTIPLDQANGRNQRLSIVLDGTATRVDTIEMVEE